MKKFLISFLIIFCFVGNVFAKTYNIKSNDDIAKLKKSDVLIIELPENPSTGFVWEFKSSNEDVIKIIEKRFVYPPTPKNQPPLCGQGGTAVYKIKAINKGSASIYGAYQRSWEKVPPIREYKLNINVE